MAGLLGRPYERLRRALNGDIAVTAWSAVRPRSSVRFPGRVAGLVAAALRSFRVEDSELRRQGPELTDSTEKSPSFSASGGGGVCSPPVLGGDLRWSVHDFSAVSQGWDKVARRLIPASGPALSCRTRMVCGEMRSDTRHWLRQAFLGLSMPQNGCVRWKRGIYLCVGGALYADEWFLHRGAITRMGAIDGAGF